MITIESKFGLLIFNNILGTSFIFRENNNKHMHYLLIVKISFFY